MKAGGIPDQHCNREQSVGRDTDLKGLRHEVENLIVPQILFHCFSITTSRPSTVSIQVQMREDPRRTLGAESKSTFAT